MCYKIVLLILCCDNHLEDVHISYYWPHLCLEVHAILILVHTCAASWCNFSTLALCYPNGTDSFDK